MVVMITGRRRIQSVFRHLGHIFRGKSFEFHQRFQRMLMAYGQQRSASVLKIPIHRIVGILLLPTILPDVAYPFRWIDAANEPKCFMPRIDVAFRFRQMWKIGRQAVDQRTIDLTDQPRRSVSFFQLRIDRLLEQFLFGAVKLGTIVSRNALK